MGDRPGVIVISVLTAVCTAVGGPVVQPVHDALAVGAGPALPVVLLDAQGAPEQAVLRARAAGADEVWSPLPSGHPDLGGAAPDPDKLGPGTDGRLRLYDGARLRLPEALRGLVSVTREQLGDAPPPDLLRGKQVVVHGGDAALAVPAALPGSIRSAQRAHALAVGLGSAATGTWLWQLRLGVAALLTGGLTAGWALWLRRRLPRRGLVETIGALGLLVGLAAGGRAMGVDLPVVGMGTGLVLGVGLRLMGAADTALDGLDRVTLRLGAPADDTSTAVPRSALAELAALYVPDFGVHLLEHGPKGQITATAQVAAAGPAGTPPPLPRRLPSRPEAGDTWHMEPVRTGGDVVAALLLFGTRPLAPDAVALVRGLAAAQDRHAQPGARPADPIDARVGLASLAVRRALDRVDRWDALLADSDVELGVFDVSGAEVSLGRGLAALVPTGSRIPLLGLIQHVGDMDEATARDTLRAAASGSALVPSAGEQSGRELVIRAVRHGDMHRGFLVYGQDQRAHVELDEMKSVMISALGFHVRNDLLAIGGYATMMAAEADAQTRTQMAEKVGDVVLRAHDILDHAERLAASNVGDAPIQPVILPECVRSALARLDPEERARVHLTMPEVSAPITARAAQLQASLAALLADLSRNGGRTSVHVHPDTDGLVLRMQDDGGGLPGSMLEHLAGTGGDTGPPAAARSLIEGMGGAFSAESLPGTGTRYTVRLRYF